MAQRDIGVGIVVVVPPWVWRRKSTFETAIEDDPEFFDVANHRLDEVLAIVK